MTEEEKKLMLDAQQKVAALSGKEVQRMAKVLEDLTPEQEIFCKEFVATGDRRKAIQAAGYTGRNASTAAARWLSREKVQNRIKQIRGKFEAKADLTRDIYLQMLQETYERAMGDGDYAGANRAAELMGKAMGYFVDQKAVLNVSSRIPEDRVQQIAEVQRLAKIAGVSFES